jgi:hypothetical protein
MKCLSAFARVLAYEPEHHNFAEHFLFEPRLEESISPTILAELEAADVLMIEFLKAAPTNTYITIHGLNGQTRRLP